MEKTISTINSLFVQWHNDIVESAQKYSAEMPQEKAATADTTVGVLNVGSGTSADEKRSTVN